MGGGASDRLREQRVAWCCSAAKSCPTLCDAMACSTPGSSVHYLPEFAQIHVPGMLSKHLILCHPLLPSIFPSLRVFPNECSSHQAYTEAHQFLEELLMRSCIQVQAESGSKFMRLREERNLKFA